MLELVKDGKIRRFGLDNGVLYVIGKRIYVPRWDNLRRELLKECHESKLEGHPGPHRTLALMSEAYYWPQMREDVDSFMRTCLVCQQDKTLQKFTKYATFIPAPADCNAEEAARLFLKHVVKYWRIPKSIISDRNSRFTGDLVFVKLNPFQHKSTRKIEDSPVFHMSNLKPYHVDPEELSGRESQRALPLMVTSFDREVKCIMAKREV
ncbi:hypothetical protein L3X38_025860 [Prunus dulcis]|uniref:Integrase zinc-binding domain-containing protein n=1 Tax=Prunus dulcis TaxID=3755 RepID=A0AAD4W396_PRUDU|nr:hypothetical protein L3X38_025860 [Prunus dulcis]